jgi:AraC-like DNA-binding protein
MPANEKAAIYIGKGSIAWRGDLEELLRLAESDIPILAFSVHRHGGREDWAPPHSHGRGQLIAVTKGLLVVEAGNERWMFPSYRCAWIPPNFAHAGRSVGGAVGSLVYLSADVCRGLPQKPCMFGSSQLLFGVIDRMLTWNPRNALSPTQKRLIEVLRDEIRHPEQQPLRLSIPKEERLARVARMQLDDVATNNTLDKWAQYAGMARRTFMRAFYAEVGMTFGRWRQQVRLFAALEMLAEGKSVTDAAVAVGYDSVSAFIDIFRATMGSTPQKYFRNKQDGAVQNAGGYSFSLPRASQLLNLLSRTNL